MRQLNFWRIIHKFIITLRRTLKFINPKYLTKLSNWIIQVVIYFDLLMLKAIDIQFYIVVKRMVEDQVNFSYQLTIINC